MDYVPPKAWSPPVVLVAKADPPAPVVRMGYPVRGSWWTGCSSWVHMTQGEHRGLFPAEWLKSLTWAELQSVHSDHHEHRTQWQYVPKK